MDQGGTMRSGLAVLVAVAAAGYSLAGRTADEPVRECQYCPFDAGGRGEVEAGAGYVSDDSFRFGDFTGLNEQGLFGIGNLFWRNTGADADYSEITASNVGLDSRSVQIKAGRQGSYRLLVGYRELPKLRSAEAVTPFIGVGSGSLTLPGGWTRASTTGGMTDLDASLRGAEIRHDRKQLDLGVALLPGEHWEYAARYRHETKQGLDRAGGDLGIIHSTLLPEPVDYTTDQIDLSARYATQAWQLQLAYYGSLFRNANEALRWQNPYTALNGEDQGQLALAPGNQFHQLLLDGNMRPGPTTHLSGRLAWGRATQDETFLSASVNPNFAGTALPRDSLDGRVNMLSANVHAMFQPMRRLRLKADYLYDDRDNRTPRDSFTQITTDTFSDTPRTNLPYSFTRQTARLGGDLRLPGSLRVSAGFEDEDRERSGQAVVQTNEQTLWGQLQTQSIGRTGYSLSLAQSRRTGSGYAAAPEIQPPPNPLQRIPYLADRDRTKVGLRIDAVPGPAFALGVAADYADDDYQHSTVGLQQGSDLNVSADASATLAEFWVLQAWLSRDVLKWEQTGSQAYAAPDWSARSRNLDDGAGLGLERRALFGRVDAALRYTWTQSTGEVTSEQGSVSAPFPDFDSRRQRLDLSGDFRATPAFSVRLGYAYERYQSSDWQIDGVLPDTISNVLALGEISPRYGVHMVGLSFVYRFEPAHAANPAQ